MESIQTKIAALPWQGITDQIHEKGFATLPALLAHEQCGRLIAEYVNPEAYRKTVVMERHRFGLGEYKYFQYPLPPVIQALRESMYPHLIPIANTWMKVLNCNEQFPPTHEEFLALCRQHEQLKATPLILKYGKGGHNTLHQDLYGEVYFPLQMAIFLSSPGEDYDGGEFVLTEQVPRAQSRPIVLRPQKGDALIFATSFRPQRGTRGYYRVNMRHGVSEVLRGNRYTLGVIFHDAVT